MSLAPGLVRTTSSRLLTRANEPELKSRSESAYRVVKQEKLARPTRFERVTFAFGGQGLLEKARAASKIRPINRSAVLMTSLQRVFLL